MWPSRKRPTPPPSSTSLESEALACPRLPEMLDRWEEYFDQSFSSIEAEAMRIREQSARLAPRGGRPEEELSPELRALAERYTENRSRLNQLEQEQARTQELLQSSLEGALEIDARLQSARQDITEQLEESRADLRNRPELSLEIEPEIRRFLRQLDLMDEISLYLHDCRWSKLRLAFTELSDLSPSSTSGLISFAIGPDPMFGGSGAVACLESLEQRLERLQNPPPLGHRFPYSI